MSESDTRYGGAADYLKDEMNVTCAIWMLPSRLEVLERMASLQIWSQTCCTSESRQRSRFVSSVVVAQRKLGTD